MVSLIQAFFKLKLKLKVLTNFKMLKYILSKKWTDTADFIYKVDFHWFSIFCTFKISACPRYLDNRQKIRIFFTRSFFSQLLSIPNSPLQIYQILACSINCTLHYMPISWNITLLEDVPRSTPGNSKVSCFKLKNQELYLTSDFGF